MCSYPVSLFSKPFIPKSLHDETQEKKKETVDEGGGEFELNCSKVPNACGVFELNVSKVKNVCFISLYFYISILDIVYILYIFITLYVEGHTA